MTLPAPSDAAIQAAANAAYGTWDVWANGPAWSEVETAMRAGLAAALPLLRAQWAAEVDAALRDNGRWLDWAGRNVMSLTASVHGGAAADYLADTLGAKPEETDRG